MIFIYILYPLYKDIECPYYIRWNLRCGEVKLKVFQGGSCWASNLGKGHRRGWLRSKWQFQIPALPGRGHPPFLEGHKLGNYSMTYLACLRNKKKWLCPSGLRKLFYHTLIWQMDWLLGILGGWHDRGLAVGETEARKCRGLLKVSQLVNGV